MPTAEYESRQDSVLAWKKAQKLGRFDPDAGTIEQQKIRASEREVEERGKFSMIVFAFPMNTVYTSKKSFDIAPGLEKNHISNSMVLTHAHDFQTKYAIRGIYILWPKLDRSCKICEHTQYLTTQRGFALEHLPLFLETASAISLHWVRLTQITLRERSAISMPAS